MRYVLFACLMVLGACGDASGEVGDADARADARMDGGAIDAASDAPLGSDGAPLDADAEADASTPTVTWFEDISLSAGIDLVRVAAEDYDSVPDRMSGGVCVIDVDGVAPLDLFFAFRPSAASKSVLYVGRGSLDYLDETTERGLSNVGDATGCLAFDAEGDGDDDLLVTGKGSLRLFENEGGSFTDVSSALLGWAPDPRDFYASAAAGDVDGDGDLDLVVAGMIRHDPAGMAALCGAVPCAAELTNFQPIPSLLFIRRADGRYDERAATEAPDLVREEPTLVVAVRDFDEDARPDIYVGNDIGIVFRDRVLSRRIDGTLRDVAEDLGLAYNRVGYGIDTMGFASGDLDGDGDLDHVESSFEGDATAVFVCDAFCEDQAARAGTGALSDSFRWAVALGDLDLDGDLDLLEAAGHYYDDDEIVALGWAMGRAQPMNLLEGVGDATFRDARRAPSDASLVAGAERSLVLVDLDDDGRLDAVTAPAVGPARVLHNVREGGHFLRVALEGRAPNRDAVGARVLVHAGAATLTRVQSRGEGYLGSGDPRLHFGLAESAPVSVEVIWPGGSSTTREAVAVDTEIVLREP